MSASFGTAAGFVTLVVDLFDVVAVVPLIEIHVDVIGAGFLFAEGDRFGGVDDDGFFDTVGPVPLVIGLEFFGAEGATEVIIPAVDDVAAPFEETVLGAFEDFGVVIIGLEAGDPRVGHVTARGEFPVVIGGVEGEGGIDLSEVTDAFDGIRLTFGAGEGRHEQGGEDSDDGDHDEHFDEGEAMEGCRPRWRTRGGMRGWRSLVGGEPLRSHNVEENRGRGVGAGGVFPDLD